MITVVVMLFLMFVAIMLFGGDSEYESDDSASGEYNYLTQDEYSQILSYDIYDWNMLDDAGKEAIAEDIIRVWMEAGYYYELSKEDLAAYISTNLYDQSMVFEVACISAQIDSVPFYELLNQ